MMGRSTISNSLHYALRRSSRPARRTRVHNRIIAVMLHIPWYTFQGQARIAKDSGVSRSTINRLLSGRSVPSYPMVQKIAAALEKRLDRRIDPRELVSLDGTYPTRSVCQLVGCGGCLPSHAYDSGDNLKEAFYGVRPGDWTYSQAPVEEPAREGVA